MRMLRLPYAEQEQQSRRMVFNAISKNIDDHTKNISYTMGRDGIWKLSPAYDMTLSFDSAELFPDQHKMTINGKQKDFTLDDFLTVGKNMEIKKSKLIIEQVIPTQSALYWKSQLMRKSCSLKVWFRVSAAENFLPCLLRIFWKPSGKKMFL